MSNLIYFLIRASYSDGKLKAPPKPCAGNQGTQITVRMEHGRGIVAKERHINIEIKLSLSFLNNSKMNLC